jgi:cytidine deaminase
MRCSICNHPLKTVVIDERDLSIMPCGTCQEAIQTTLNQMDTTRFNSEVDDDSDFGYTLYEEE